MAKKSRKKSKSRRITDEAFEEVYSDEPAIVGKTRRKYGKARAAKQKKAIALSKARRRGARIPRKRG